MKIFATFILAIFSFFPLFVYSELRIDITKGNLDPIPIAILKFNSNKQEEIDFSKNINEVIKNNLSRSGLFSVLPSKIFLNNKKTVKITKTKKQKQFASYSIVKTMRAGILVLGPLVAKYHKSISSFPGGCVLNGNSGRPINLHLEALKKLGMKYEIKKGYIHAKSNGKLKGNKIKFPAISVGASQQLIMSSVLAKGKTLLHNLAC